MKHGPRVSTRSSIVLVVSYACCLTAHPYFLHHQAIILTLEDGSDYCAEKMCTLLRYMATSAILTRDQITKVCVLCLCAYKQVVIFPMVCSRDFCEFSMT